VPAFITAVDSSLAGVLSSGAAGAGLFFFEQLVSNKITVNNLIRSFFI
jgi:hypothetical protein